MSDDDLKHFGAIGDALHNLWDAAEEQQKTALHQQQAAEAAIRAVNVATASLRDMSTGMKGQLATEVQRALQDASQKSAQLLTEKFAEANEQADLAAGNYRSAVKWASWQIFALVICVGAAVAAGGAVGASGLYSEVKSLREEKAQLQSSVDALTQRGGRARVVPCTDSAKRQRMCVWITDEKSGERNPAIIYGY